MPYDPIAGIRGGLTGYPVDEVMLNEERTSALDQQPQPRTPASSDGPPNDFEPMTLKGVSAPAPAQVPARRAAISAPAAPVDERDDVFRPAPDTLKPLFATAEEITGVPASLLEGIGFNESRWRDDVITGQKKSKKGATGMMQFTPIGIREVENLTGRKFNPDDPQEAAIAAGEYLKSLYNKFDQDWAKALAAYNWGETVLRRTIKEHGDDWIKYAPTETTKYVERLLPLIAALDPDRSTLTASTDPRAHLMMMEARAQGPAVPPNYRRAIPVDEPEQLGFGRPGHDEPAGAQLLFDPQELAAGFGQYGAGVRIPEIMQRPDDFEGSQGPVKYTRPTGGRGTVFTIGAKNLQKNVIGTVNMLSRAAGLGDIGADSIAALEEEIAALEETLPESIMNQRSAMWSQLGKGSVWSEPGAILTQLVENLPNFAATLGTGVLAGLVGRVLMWSPKLITAVAGATGGATEGTIVTGAVYNELVTGIRESQDAGLMASPVYKALRDEGLSEEDAKEALIDELGPRASLTAGAVSTVLGTVATGYIGRLVGAGRQARMMRPGIAERRAIRASMPAGAARTAALKARAMRTPGRVATGLRGAGVEALTEAGQEGQETVAGNIAAQQSYDPSRGTYQDVPESMAAGAGLGAIMGAGPAALAPRGRVPPAAPPPQETPPAGTPPAAARPGPTGPELAGPGAAAAAAQRVQRQQAAVPPVPRPAAPTDEEAAARRAARQQAAGAPVPPGGPPAAPAATEGEAAAPSKRTFEALEVRTVKKELAKLEPLKSSNNVARAVRDFVKRISGLEPDVDLPAANRQRSPEALAKLLVAVDEQLGDKYPNLSGDISAALATKDPGTAIKALAQLIDKLAAEKVRADAGIQGEVTADTDVQLSQAEALYDSEIESLRRNRNKKGTSKAKRAPADKRAIALESLANAVERALDEAITKNPELKGAEGIRKTIKQVRQAAKTAMTAPDKRTGNTQTKALPATLSHTTQDRRERILKRAAEQLHKALAGEPASLENIAEEESQAATTRKVKAKKEAAKKAAAEPEQSEETGREKVARLAGVTLVEQGGKKVTTTIEEIRAKAAKKREEREKDKAEKQKVKPRTGKTKPATTKPKEASRAEVKTKGQKAEEIKAKVAQRKAERAKPANAVITALRQQYTNAKVFIANAVTRPIAEVRGLAKSLGVKLGGNRQQIAKRIAAVVWPTPPTQGDKTKAVAKPEPETTGKRPEMSIPSKPIAGRGVKTALRDAGFDEAMDTAAVRESVFPDFNNEQWAKVRGLLSMLTKPQREVFGEIRNTVVEATNNDALGNAWLQLSAWMEDIDGLRVPDDVQATVRDLTSRQREIYQEYLPERQATQLGEQVVVEGELEGFQTQQTGEERVAQREESREQELLALQLEQEMDDAGLTESEKRQRRLEVFGSEQGLGMTTNIDMMEQGEQIDLQDFEFLQTGEYYSEPLTRQRLEENAARFSLFASTEADIISHRLGGLLQQMREMARQLYPRVDLGDLQIQAGEYRDTGETAITVAGISETLDSDRTLDEMLQLLPDALPIRDVMVRLRNLNLNVRIVPVHKLLQEGKEVAGAFKFAWSGDEATGYSPTTARGGIIYINVGVLSDANALGTIVHELIHAATNMAYISNPLLRAKVDGLLDAVRESLTASWGAERVRNIYGLTNPMEMMAEAFSDKDFQFLLMSVSSRTNPRRSVFTEFVNLIKQIFGYAPDHRTALDDVVELSSRMLRNNLQQRNLATIRMAREVAERLGTGYGRAISASSPATVNAVLKSFKSQSAYGKFRDRLRDGWVAFHTLDQIEARYKRFFERAATTFKEAGNSLTAYLAGMRLKRSLAHEQHAKAEKVNARWRQLSRAEDLAVSTALRDGTLWQIDPTLPFAEHTWLQNRNKKKQARNQKGYDKVVAEYDALTPEAREVFRDVVNYFREQRESIREAFMDNLMEKYQLDEKWREFLRHMKTSEDVEWFIRAPSYISKARQSSFWHNVGEEFRDRFRENIDPKIIDDLVRDIKEITAMSGIRGTYVPLRRFGDYVVKVKEENNVEFDTREEAIDFARDLEMQSPANKVHDVYQLTAGPTAGKWTISADVYHLELVADSATAAQRQAALQELGYKEVTVTRKEDAVYSTTADLSPMFASLMRKFKGAPELRAQLQVAFTELLADNAMRASSLKRDAFTGVDPKEMRRAFAERAYAGGWALGDFKTAEMRRQALTQMSEDSRDTTADRETVLTRGRILKEIGKREAHDSSDRKRNVISDGIAKTGFLWFLLSPSYSVVNATQVVMFALPYLGGIYSWGNATREIGAAYKQVLGPFMQGVKETKAGLAYKKTADVFIERIKAAITNPAELEAINYLESQGLMEVTFMQEIVDTAKGIEGTTFETVMQIARTLPQGVEVLNRVVTGLATYRLEMKKSGDVALAKEAMLDATRQTQLDYSMMNRPRAFKFPGGRAVMLFKMFGQGVYNLLISNIYDAFKGAGRPKAEARRILGGIIAMHTLTAGVLGGIMIEPLRWVINGAMMAWANTFGDEDEPFDIDFAVRDFLVNGVKLSPEVAGAISHGPARLTNAETFTRIGLHQLMFMGDFNLATDATTLRTIGTLVGPAASMALAPIDSMRRWSEGDAYGAVQQALPAKLARDLMSSYDMGMRGLTDRRGVTYVEADQFGFGSMAMQAFGFQPTRKSEPAMARRQVKQYEMFKSQRKQNLQSRWHNADSQQERSRIWRDEIVPFNQTIPPKERIKRGSLFKTAAQRRKEARAATGGVYSTRSVGLPRASAYAVP